MPVKPGVVVQISYDQLTEGRFRHMPVVDADDSMIGILSIGDVVKARLEEIEAENAAMADMLSH